MSAKRHSAKEVISANVIARMAELGISRFRLSQLLQITPQSAINLVDGIHEPSAGRLLAVARVLGVTVDSLLTPPEFSADSAADSAADRAAG